MNERNLQASIVGTGEARDGQGLTEYMKPAALRRIDGFTKPALLSLLRAADGLPTVNDPARTGLVLGTDYGPTGSSLRYLKDIILDGDEFASPTWFSSSIHNAPAGQLSINTDIRGPVRTLAAGKQTPGMALLTALGWLKDGRADRVFVTWGEEASPLLDLINPDTPPEALVFRTFCLKVSETDGLGVLRMEQDGQGEMELVAEFRKQGTVLRFGV